MKWNGVALLVLLVFSAGCGGPAGLKAADDLALNRDYLGAVKVYDRVLQNVSDDATRRPIEKKLENTKVALVDEYLMQAGEQYLEMGTPDIPTLGIILNSLQSVQQWDDTKGRIGRSVAFYKEKIAKIHALVELYLSKAIIAAYAFEYTLALQVIDAAEKLDPENRSVDFARTRVKRRQVFYGEVLTLLAEKDVDGAVEKFHKLAATFNPHPSLTAAPFAADVLALIEEKVRSLTADNRWHEAVNYIKRLNLPELNGLLRDVRRGAVDHFPRTAETHRKK